MRRAYPILHIILIAAMLVAAFAMAGESAPLAWPAPFPGGSKASGAAPDPQGAPMPAAPVGLARL